MTISLLHTRLNTFRNDEKYCDVKIIVEGRKFPCHRVVLAASSEYFDALFGGSFKEKDAKETVLEGIDVESFLDLMEYIYTGSECKITVCNVSRLLRASLYLRVSPIEESCIKFIRQKIWLIQDHVALFMLFRFINVTDLAEVLSLYIVKNFENLFDDKNFMNMSFVDLKFILCKWVQYGSPLKHEHLLSDLLIRWVYFSPKGRREQFKELLESMDFEKIPPEYITFMLKNSKFDQNFAMHFENRLWLKHQIVKYVTVNEPLSDDFRNEMPLPFVSPKSYKDKLGLHVYIELKRKDCLYTEEGILKSIKSLRRKKITAFSINRYNPEWTPSGVPDKWSSLHDWCIGVPEPFDLIYSLEIVRNEFAPNNIQQKFCTYSSIDMNVVSNILKFPSCALYPDNFNMAAALFGIFLYNPNDVMITDELYYYKCDIDNWFPLPRVSNGHHYSHLVVDDNLLYLLGGRDRNSEYPNESTSCVAALDYRTRKWMELPSSGDIHCDHVSKSCILNGKIYVSNERNLESFDPKAQRWESIKMPPKDMSISFLMAYEDMLWIIAHAEKPSPNYQIATFNPSISQEWCIDELSSLNKAIDKYTHEFWKSDNTHVYSLYQPKVKNVIAFKT